MSDLIERQDAVDTLNRQAEAMQEWHERYAEQRKGVLSAVNLIEALPSAEPKWIPVSERLPEYRKTVLISSFWGVRIAWRDTIKEDGTDDFWCCPLEDSDVYPQYVYAWMPMPTAYKASEEE